MVAGCAEGALCFKTIRVDRGHLASAMRLSMSFATSVQARSLESSVMAQLLMWSDVELAHW
jgi:hypothetical protein